MGSRQRSRARPWPAGGTIALPRRLKRQPSGLFYGLSRQNDARWISSFGTRIVLTDLATECRRPAPRKAHPRRHSPSSQSFQRSAPGPPSRFPTTVGPGTQGWSESAMGYVYMDVSNSGTHRDASTEARLGPRAAMVREIQVPHDLHLYCVDCGADVRVRGLPRATVRPSRCVLCGSGFILSAFVRSPPRPSTSPTSKTRVHAKSPEDSGTPVSPAQRSRRVRN